MGWRGGEGRCCGVVVCRGVEVVSFLASVGFLSEQIDFSD